LFQLDKHIASNTFGSRRARPQDLAFQLIQRLAVGELFDNCPMWTVPLAQAPQDIRQFIA
jgi:hypothetical protein